MSRTNKHHRSIKSHKLTPNKIPPYSVNRHYKFVVDLGLCTGVSKTGKLVTKNANRSLKKAKRRELKKEIQWDL